MGAGSPEVALPAAEPRLVGLGRRTHLSPQRRAGRSAAQAHGPGLEVGPLVGLGVEMSGADYAQSPLKPQPVCEVGLATAAAEPSGLGAAPGPGRPPLSERARPRPAPPAESRHSINNHKPPAHPPLKINNSVIRVISEAS